MIIDFRFNSSHKFQLNTDANLCKCPKYLYGYGMHPVHLFWGFHDYVDSFGVFMIVGDSIFFSNLKKHSNYKDAYNLYACKFVAKEDIFRGCKKIDSPELINRITMLELTG